ncbi:putative Phage_integrase [Klebsormidium nitens]|uniref:Putative Phage_integrase n=1 Tax=Klebsormidium nitens TaxID=105231 RepID=A0A1Y1I1J2_KLENI|nr:putative Phage_integrase [Klebsormidium nitens]|eukprot:GAQ82636.1 putative Phage_integrase [Klebsormidium nitens]
MALRALGVPGKGDARLAIVGGAGISSGALEVNAESRREFQERCRAHVLQVRGIEGGRGGQSAGNVWSEAETEALYARSLSEFGRIAERKVTPAANTSRKRAAREFAEFLGKNPYGVTIETATPADVGAFIVGDWLPRHSGNCRTVLPSTGQTVASASAVKGVVKDLSKTYTLLGFPGHENPAKAEPVKSFRDGYERYLHDEGVKVQRAKVFSEEKLDALLRFLSERLQAETEALELCTLLMDQAAVLYLWESLARGKECGTLSADQVEGGATPAAYPGWSKTVRQEPSARIRLAQPATTSRLTFVEAAARLVKGLELIGEHATDGYLFRAQNRQRTGFSPGPISSACLRKRIQRRLQQADLFEGETLHSFRRSAVQHAAVNLNYNVKQLMELGRWKSYSAFKVYVEEVWQRR